MSDTAAARRKRNAKPDPEDEGAPAHDAASANEGELADTGDEQEQTATQEQSGDGEGTDPTLAGPQDSGEAPEDSTESFDREVLVAHAADMLPDYDPAAVRGVLAGAPNEPITLAEARQRLDRFLSAPIPTSQEA